MSVTHKLYNIGNKEIVNRRLNWEDEKIRITLLYSYENIFNPRHNIFRDIDYFEIGCERQMLKNKKTIIFQGQKIFMADNVTWDGSFAATAAVMYYNDEVQILLSYIDFGGIEYSIDGEFKIIWHEKGIYLTKENPSLDRKGEEQEWKKKSWLQRLFC